MEEVWQSEAKACSDRAYEFLHPKVISQAHDPVHLQLTCTCLHQFVELLTRVGLASHRCVELLMRVGCSESVLCSRFYVLVFEILQLLSHGVSYVSFVYPAIDVANKVFRERRVETKIKKTKH